MICWPGHCTNTVSTYHPGHTLEPSVSWLSLTLSTHWCCPLLTTAQPPLPLPHTQKNLLFSCPRVLEHLRSRLHQDMPRPTHQTGPHDTWFARSSTQTPRTRELLALQSSIRDGPTASTASPASSAPGTALLKEDTEPQQTPPDPKSTDSCQATTTGPRGYQKPCWMFSRRPPEVGLCLLSPQSFSPHQEDASLLRRVRGSGKSMPPRSLLPVSGSVPLSSASPSSLGELHFLHPGVPFLQTTVT